MVELFLFLVGCFFEFLSFPEEEEEEDEGLEDREVPVERVELEDELPLPPGEEMRALGGASFSWWRIVMY